MHYLRRAASQGHAAACFRLGALTQAGSAVPRDIEEAAVLFAQAAEQGHAEAQLRLGEMLEGGEGVAVDSAAAGRWYRLALRQPGPQQPVAAHNLCGTQSGSHAYFQRVLPRQRLENWSDG